MKQPEILPSFLLQDAFRMTVVEKEQFVCLMAKRHYASEALQPLSLLFRLLAAYLLPLEVKCVQGSP